MFLTNKMTIIAGLFLVSGCQELQSGINGIDSSIQSFNQKLSPNSVKSETKEVNNYSSAMSVNGLKEICADYTGNAMYAEKKWTGKAISIKNAKIIRVSEFNSARTMGANVHGEYGILFKTSDTNKCLARLHIQYYSGLENDIMKMKKGDSVNLSAKINDFSSLSNWSENTATEGNSTVVDLTGVITK
ncbi:hypothetical protein [Pseudomonas cerasi]